ncbi:hypothetical protein EDD15DRAFT_2204186 [Pisolithus albus]|nr:hypothetical protein EDD15DRAFT_2204186 [Pisolithus albus]
MPTLGTPPGTARTKTPVTRNNTRSTAQAGFKDPLATQISTVTDHASGLRYLVKRELLPEGARPTTSNLSTALLFIAQLPHLPAPALDGIRAVAYLLDTVETDSLTAEIQNTLQQTLSESVTKHVVASISPHVASLQDSVTKLHPDAPNSQQTSPTHADNQALAALLPDVKATHESVNQLKEKLSILDSLHQYLATTTPSDLTTPLEQIESMVNTVNLGLTDVNMSIDVLLPSLNATQSQVNSLHEHLVSHPPTPPQTTLGLAAPPPTRLYSDAAKSPPTAPRLAAAALAKAETRTRQVLFTPTPTQSLYSKDTDPLSIAADISDLLITLEDEVAPYTNIKSAVCLNNGNLLLELNSAEAAQWIRSAPIRGVFSAKLGIDAVDDRQTMAAASNDCPGVQSPPVYPGQFHQETDRPHCR